MNSCFECKHKMCYIYNAFLSLLDGPKPLYQFHLYNCLIIWGVVFLAWLVKYPQEFLWTCWIPDLTFVMMVGHWQSPRRCPLSHSFLKYMDFCENGIKHLCRKENFFKSQNRKDCSKLQHLNKHWSSMSGGWKIEKLIIREALNIYY